MSQQSLHELDATFVAQMIKSGEISASEVVEASLGVIDRLNEDFRAIVSVDRVGALAAASAIDGYSLEEAGPLTGVPIAIKDITETATLPTTFGSKSVRGKSPVRDALIVRRIREAGGIILAKTAAPEFALRPTTESVLYGPTRNAWNREYGSGGSSGGSAVAVATGMVPIAHGTDGGGSVRIPASCNGVVGLKPSRGRIPGAPTSYESWAGLSTDGIISRSVRDAAAFLQVMAGPTLGDPYAVALGDTSFVDACDQPLSKARVGFTINPPHGNVAPNIVESMDSVSRTLVDLGHDVREVCPEWKGMYDEFLTVLAGNAGALRYGIQDNRLSDLEGSTLALMMKGLEITAARYCSAVDTLRQRAACVLDLWRSIDFLVTPVLTHLPARLGEMPSSYDLVGRWEEYMAWQSFTYPFNVTGQPAVALPCTVDSDSKLPIAIQIVAAPGQEARLLSFAAAFERAQPWRTMSPYA